MVRGLNKVLVIGNVGRDPEMRYIPSGKPVTSFSVATSRSWTNSEGERREETEWFKGQQVYVEGRLQTRSWEDHEGRKRFRTELVASEMILLGGRRGVSEAIEATGVGEEEFPF